MMGALGNGRRGGRSPSLLMAALIACVLLLGFNYWVSNSRNMELQTKLLELEERVRQASADREREEMGRSEAEKQLRQKAEQLNLMEDNHQKQQLNAQNMWEQEKGKLLLNISSSAKTVQEMKNQMKTLLEDLSKVQKQLQSCQSNMNTLNKKLTYDMTQCNAQILAQKEECSEKIEAAKQEVQKKFEKHPSTVPIQGATFSTQKANDSKPVSEVLPGNDSDKSAGEQVNKEQDPKLKPKTDDHLKTTVKLADKAVVTVKASDKPKLPSTSKPSKPSSQNVTQKSLANEEALEGVMDIKGGDLKAADALLDAAMNKEGKEDDAIEYDNEGEIEKRLSKLKDDKAAAQEFEEELADYNGDEENEPESEADKQAELAVV
ncbi:hypothetical protein NFI96_028408 [Prochilodus magdalenae]|nr:hypothetical protein NFI96_028408 [Prochilodus magdalenae]